jgi:RepB DNA-primase from phage plasmid
MDKIESTVRIMLTAIEAPLYDVGVLSERGMLPRLDGISAAAILDRLSLLKYRNAHGSHIYIRPSGEHRFTTLDDLRETSLARLAVDGFNPCAVVETSAGNFQAWLMHSRVFPKLLGTFAAQTLAGRYDADPSAADWRRFGRLPGFTNCKPKYRKPDGLFPFVRLHSHSGQQYPMAVAFEQEITTLYEAREQEREARRLQSSLSPQRGPRLSNLSLERFELRPSTRTGPPLLI